MTLNGSSMPGPSPREVVGSVLLDRAVWVQRRLEQSHSLGAPLDEETLTQTLLLDLRAMLGAQVQVSEFTRAAESRATGADWEWWFCDSLGGRLFGMRVQAKKLKWIRVGVAGYDFKYTPQSERKKAKPTRQVDRLLQAAARDHLPAVYALYNGAELDLSTFAWGCCFAPNREAFGVALLAADAARNAADIGDGSLASIGHLARPWSCCALCPTNLRVSATLPYWPADPKPTLSLYAADLVAHILALSSESADGRRLTSEALAIAGDGFREWRSAPSYVRQMVEVVDATGGQSEFLEVPTDLGGVVIFREH